ncbi:4-hydroxyphenylacetate 3-hydroxylase C-terminal domain-containing protein [Shigella flexneri]
MIYLPSSASDMNNPQIDHIWRGMFAAQMVWIQVERMKFFKLMWDAIRQRIWWSSRAV